MSAGNPYIVGEEGPELFVPSGTGTIIPNGQMGGGGIRIESIVINANSYAEGRAAARGFAEELQLLLNEAGEWIPY